MDKSIRRSAYPNCWVALAPRGNASGARIEPLEKFGTIMKKSDYRCRKGIVSMKLRLLIAVVVSMGSATCFAQTTEWRRYVIPSTGANVDIPVSIFSEDAGAPEGGTGRRFFTEDRRADLTIQSVPNSGNDSPAEFLQKRRPPPGIQYKRVTPRFFAVSSVRAGRTWYNRCNRANGYMHCVLINYPAAEDRQWDAIVTRISLSLAQ